jgi:NADP-dependent 3-hydroxy acid dehydrogenase YdfG
VSEPRRIFLTGASSGIGRETARFLARDGHRVALFARRQTELAALAKELGAGVLALPGDVTDRARLESAVAEAAAHFGGLDALIYAAGGARFHSVEATSWEGWREMMGANLDGLFHASQAVLPSLLASRRGHVVGILSIASRHAFGGSSAYTAAKHGALGFLDSLRVEVRARGIHVTTILPGAVDTPLWDAIDGEWDRAKMMQPEQVARVIAALFRDTTTGMLEEIRLAPVAGSL